MKSLIGIVLIINIHYVCNFKKNESFVSVIERVEENGDFCIKCESLQNTKEILILMKNNKIIYSSHSPLNYWIRSVDDHDTGKYHCIAQDKYIKTIKLILVPSKKAKSVKENTKDLLNGTKRYFTNEIDNTDKESNTDEIGKLLPHIRYIERRPLSTKICFEFKLYIDDQTEHFPTMEYIVNLKDLEEYNSILFKEEGRYCLAIFAESISSWSFNRSPVFENRTNASRINISKLESNSPLSIYSNNLNFDKNIFTFYRKSFDDNSKIKLNIIDIANNSETYSENMTSLRSTIVTSLKFNKTYCVFLSYYKDTPDKYNPPCTIILYTELLNFSIKNETPVDDKSSDSSKIRPNKKVNLNSDATKAKFVKSKMYMILTEIGTPKISNRTYIKKYWLIFRNHENRQKLFTKPIKVLEKLVINYQYNVSGIFINRMTYDSSYSSNIDCTRNSFSIEFDLDRIIILFHPDEYFKTQLKGYVISIKSQTRIYRYHVDPSKENFTFIDNSYLFILKNITVLFVFEDKSCLYAKTQKVKSQTTNHNQRSFFRAMQQPEIMLVFVYIPLIIYALIVFRGCAETRYGVQHTSMGICTQSNCS